MERDEAIRFSSVNRELAATVARLERELEQERAIVASLRELVTTDHESKEAFIRRCRQTLGMNEAGDPPNQQEP